MPAFQCPLCAQLVDLADITPHMDACRDERVTALAASLSIPEHVALLFRAQIHDANKHAASATSDAEGVGDLLDAASAAGGHPSFAHFAPFSSTDASPAEHAIVMLPRGPAYILSDADAHEVLPGLWLGSEAAARGVEFLRTRGISAVVNCAIDSEPLYEDERVKAGVSFYEWVRIVDMPGKENREAIDKALVAVGKACAHAERNGGGVLVHCIAGVSRSATVVIAHLMKDRSYSLLDAATLVKRARKVVYPNVGFFKCLFDLEIEYRGESSLPPNALQLHKGTPMTAVRVKNKQVIDI
jgi:protein-tyrosine phosphatase